MSNTKKYCNNLTAYSRFLTREVKIGELLLGGNNPIRVQSMTTTDTMDTKATIAQSIRMIEAGCELVRITAPSMNEAKNLEFIKNYENYKVPIKQRGNETFYKKRTAKDSELNILKSIDDDRYFIFFVIRLIFWGGAIFKIKSYTPGHFVIFGIK